MRKIKRLLSRKYAIGKQLFLQWCSAQLNFYKFAKYSFKEQAPDREIEQLKYYLIKHSHIVEKGMALPFPRDAFGQPKIKDIIERTKMYESLGGTDVGPIVRDTLKEYRKLYQDKEDLFEPKFIETVDLFLKGSMSTGKGGLKNLQKFMWKKWTLEEYDEFVSYRHSVRCFDKKPIDVEILKSVITTGMKAPSVCNRQGWFVHYYCDRSKIAELLKYQNGNAGFSDCIDKLLIVTGDIKAFTKNEQNQLFIDGGLVSMNLMLAIHAAGLGSCPLNTSMPYWQEKKLIDAAGIPDNERLIMLIAVGNLKNEFSVAQSEKYKINLGSVAH